MSPRTIVVAGWVPPAAANINDALIHGLSWRLSQTPLTAFSGDVLIVSAQMDNLRGGRGPAGYGLLAAAHIDMVTI